MHLQRKWVRRVHRHKDRVKPTGIFQQLRWGFPVDHGIRRLVREKILRLVYYIWCRGRDRVKQRTVVMMFISQTRDMSGLSNWGPAAAIMEAWNLNAFNNKSKWTDSRIRNTENGHSVSPFSAQKTRVAYVELDENLKGQKRVEWPWDGRWIWDRNGPRFWIWQLGNRQGQTTRRPYSDLIQIPLTLKFATDTIPPMSLSSFCSVYVALKITYKNFFDPQIRFAVGSSDMSVFQKRDAISCVRVVSWRAEEDLNSKRSV